MLSKMWKQTFSLLSAVAFVACSCGLSFAATYEMKLAHSNPERNYSHLHSPLVLFKDEVERRTKGDIKVTIYPNGTLGAQKALMEQLARGIIQSVSISEGGVAPFYPEIAALSIPYLFKEVDIAYEVLDGPLGDFFREDMAKKTGMRPLAWGEDAGFRHLTNSKRAIKTPADIKGMKIRTMPVAAHMEMVKALGGSPTPVSWSELYTALQTKVVDGEENPISNIRNARLEEVQKYLTLDGHLYSFVAIYVNERWFKSLPPDYQRILLTSGKLAAQSTRYLSRINESIDLAYLESKGMEVYAPTAEEKEAFRTAAQAPVIASLKQTLDPALIDKVLEETAKVEKKLGY
jgi:TRAP transporter solute receptor, dctP family